MKHTVAALLVVVAVVAGAPTVAAQSDGGVLDDFMDGEDDGTDWSAAAKGVLNKNLWWVNNAIGFSDEESDQAAAEGDRADLQEVFHANNATLENYSSTHFDGNASEWDVIQITHVRDDGEATHYLVADANNSTFTNARMVNSTSRTVDHEVTLEGYASDNAHAELQTFVDEYAANDTKVTRSYAARLAAEYSGYVDRPEALTDDDN